MSAVRQPRPHRVEPSWSAAQLRRWARDELAEELDRIAGEGLRIRDQLRRAGYDVPARGYQARADAAAELAAAIRSEPAWWSPSPATSTSTDGDESDCT